MFEEMVVQSVKIFSLIRKLYVTVITSNGQKHAPVREEQSCGFPGRALTDALAFEESALVQDRFPTASQQKVVLCLQMQPSPSQIGDFGSMIPFLPPVLKPGALAFLWRYNTLRKINTFLFLVQWFCLERAGGPRLTVMKASCIYVRGGLPDFI